jgi:hypothetical protein
LLSSLFLSKNQKLVKKWTQEHEQIIILTNQVLAEYSKNKHKNAKKALIKLNNILVDHVTDENIEFYKLLKDETRVSIKNKKATKEFVDSFKDMRLDLMKFLTHYTKRKTVLDEEFFVTLNGIADVLQERIDFEEKNLYTLLSIPKSKERRDAKEWERLKTY